jgi:Holliday junction resolvase RusA-like endonuclease
MTEHTQTVTFTIPGPVVGKGRPRATARGGFVQLYTPKKTASYENLVALAARDAMAGRDPFQGGVMLNIDFGCQIPASWSRKKQNRALDGDVLPLVKPDIDNVVKTMCDAMNGIVYRDDVQVVTLAISKHYTHKPDARIEVIAFDSYVNVTPERLERDKCSHSITATSL